MNRFILQIMFKFYQENLIKVSMQANFKYNSNSFAGKLPRLNKLSSVNLQLNLICLIKLV